MGIKKKVVREVIRSTRKLLRGEYKRRQGSFKQAKKDYGVSDSQIDKILGSLEKGWDKVDYWAMEYCEGAAKACGLPR